MSKKEILWRDILYQAIEKKNFEFTQKKLAEKFGFSLSTVFNALKIPRQSGAIKVTGKNFTVIDAEKFLMLWATIRNLEKDIIYHTYIPKSIQETESQMPAQAIFGCYSAYVLRYKDAPADYSKVYIYAKEADLEIIKKRFSFNKKEPNFFVLKTDSYFIQQDGIIADIQIFVDLWNMKDWYAKDFLNALKIRLFP